MQLISEIDPYVPDEDLVEVFIGSFNTWGIIEAQLLFPALEAAFEGSDDLIAAARDRLNALHVLEETIHLGEGAEDPFNDLARKYIDGVKYHLVLDVQDIAQLAAQLPTGLGKELMEGMASMKADME